MTSAELLPAAVLKRKAVVYVRQFTLAQVQSNLESRRRQYELVDVARQRGFRDIEVIDDDLGRYLRQFSADYLKIDGSFVRNMSGNPDDAAVVSAINEVGHALGIATVGEFAHDAITVRCLRRMGVDYAQGHALGAPEPLERLLGGQSAISRRIQ